LGTEIHAEITQGVYHPFTHKKAAQWITPRGGFSDAEGA
jgi:hypothetical protein